MICFHFVHVAPLLIHEASSRERGAEQYPNDFSFITGVSRDQALEHDIDFQQFSSKVRNLLRSVQNKDPPHFVPAWNVAMWHRSSIRGFI